MTYQSRPDVNVYNPAKPTPTEMFKIAAAKHLAAGMILFFTAIISAVLVGSLAGFELRLSLYAGLYAGVILAMAVALYFVRYCLAPEPDVRPQRAAVAPPAVLQPPAPPPSTGGNKSINRIVAEAARANRAPAATGARYQQPAAATADPAITIGLDESAEVRKLALTLANEGQCAKRVIVDERKMMNYETYRVATDRLVELGILAPNKRSLGESLGSRKVWLEQEHDQGIHLLFAENEDEQTEP